ncbi:MAG: hypothetical protein GYB51_21280 [Rhodobacteraceae bacterium]|nr:hypothetical protein [Paracoccaceae bacterium]
MTSPSGMSLPVPELTAFHVRDDPAPLVPAEARRPWMDATQDRFAYRCIPMSIANATGWEILAPVGFSVRWSGGTGKEALAVSALHPEEAGQVASFVGSHFGHGILTFRPGYLFRTSPGWALWVRGAPNCPYGLLQPLEGLVETDWLPLGFTMNWRFVQPGALQIPAGERLCFVTPVPHAVLGEITPQVRDLSEDPELQARHESWSESRRSFISDLDARQPEAVRQGWQRHYLQGDSQGGPPPGYHVTKRRMKTPREDL